MRVALSFCVAVLFFVPCYVNPVMLSHLRMFYNFYIMYYSIKFKIQSTQRKYLKIFHYVLFCLVVIVARVSKYRTEKSNN